MELIAAAVDFIVHLDLYLAAIIATYGIWAYIILFLVVFCETGLVAFPFRPGDSLLFAAGALSASGALDLAALFLVLALAAILGDTANYWIGYFAGPHIFTKKKSLLFNPEYLGRAHAFYKKHGGKAIVIARFIPIIRTFAPFVAGIGKMSYRRFLAYNILGGIAWVAIFLLGGYYFGNLAFVKQNFALVVTAIIIISLLPALAEVLRHCPKRR